MSFAATKSTNTDPDFFLAEQLYPQRTELHKEMDGIEKVFTIFKQGILA